MALTYGLSLRFVYRSVPVSFGGREFQGVGGRCDRCRAVIVGVLVHERDRVGVEDLSVAAGDAGAGTRRAWLARLLDREPAHGSAPDCCRELMKASTAMFPRRSALAPSLSAMRIRARIKLRASGTVRCPSGVGAGADRDRIHARCTPDGGATRQHARWRATMGGMEALGWIVLCAALGSVVYFVFQRGANKADNEVRRLTRDCGGDRELVERLIFAEMQRDSSISMSVAASRARRRLARDRR
jgi:hypothetical protein